MSEYKITTDHLYTICSKKKQEIDNIIDSVHKLVDYLNGSIDAGIVPPEIIEPLTERWFVVLKILEKINGMIQDFCDFRLAACMSVNNVSLRIEKEQELVFSLQDINSLDVRFADLINDCSYTFDYWCKQKWLNGKSGIDFCPLLVEYQYLTSSLKEELIPALEEDIYQTSCFIDQISMACVYASPEIMMGKLSDSTQTQTYPYIHSVSDGDPEDDPYICEIYGAPQMIMDYQNKHKNESIQNDERKTVFCIHCGKAMTNQNIFCPACGQLNIVADKDVTLQFCQKCGGSNPMIAKYCMFCGNSMRERNISANPTPPMACVYSSPEMLSSEKRKKEGFITKLFKR